MPVRALRALHAHRGWKPLHPGFAVVNRYPHLNVVQIHTLTAKNTNTKHYFNYPTKEKNNKYNQILPRRDINVLTGRTPEFNAKTSKRAEDTTAGKDSASRVGLATTADSTSEEDPAEAGDSDRKTKVGSTFQRAFVVFRKRGFGSSRRERGAAPTLYRGAVYAEVK
jgi:hypothetical protein